MRQNVRRLGNHVRFDATAGHRALELSAWTNGHLAPDRHGGRAPGGDDGRQRRLSEFLQPSTGAGERVSRLAEVWDIIHLRRVVVRGLPQLEQLIDGDWKIADTHAGGVEDCIGDRGGRADDADFADALHAERV